MDSQYFETEQRGLEQRESDLMGIMNDLAQACILPPEANQDFLKEMIEGNPELTGAHLALLMRHTVASSPQPEVVVTLLLELGADPNLDHDGRHPLHEAARRGNTLLVGTLLAHLADPELRNREGMSAEKVAYSEGHKACAEFIHQAKHDFNKPEYQAVCCLGQDVLSGKVAGDQGLLTRLKSMEDNECLDCAVSEERTLAMLSCKRGFEESFVFLANRDCSINTSGGKIQFSAIHDACQLGLSAVVRWTIDTRPEMLSVELGGHLPIHVAVQSEQVVVVKMLLSYLENSARGEEPLPFAIESLAHGGASALLMACLLRNLEIATEMLSTLEYLDKRKKLQRPLSEMLNYMHKDQEGNAMLGNCLHQALHREHPEVRLVRLLLEKGADPNLNFPGDQTTQYTKSPLVQATELGEDRLEITEALILAGAVDISQKALFGAEISKDEELSDLLLATCWPVKPDVYQCRYCTNLPSVANAKLVKVLKEIPGQNGFKKTLVEDNKILFQRKLLAAGFMTRNGIVFQNDDRGFLISPLIISVKNLIVASTLTQSSLLKSIEYYHRKDSLSPTLDAQRISKTLLLDLVTTIELDHCTILERLPEFLLTAFPNVRHFLVSNNSMMKHLPPDIDPACSKIEKLSLQNNGIVDVPPWIFFMRHLCWLDLSGNKIESLPIEMWVARSLQELDLSRNTNLKQLPDGNLVSIISSEAPRISTGLNLNPLKTPVNQHTGSLEDEGGGSVSEKNDHDQITEQMLHTSNIPVKRASFFDDRYVPANDAKPIHVLSPDESEVTNGLRFHTLKVNECSLEKLPENLPCLAPRLSYLHCDRNKITRISIPQQFPTSVQGLFFQGNDIRSTSDFEKDLKCLRANDIPQTDAPLDRPDDAYKDIYYADCRHNNHKRLENLQSLDLSKNPNLSHVDFNYLKHMTVKEVYEETMLPSLGNLFIQECNLSEIPSCISQIRNLQWLNISKNPKITAIPDQFSNLEKLLTFDFEGCSIDDPVLKTKTEQTPAKEIVRYLSIRREGKVPWRRMKLMFIGEPSAGKSSLVRALSRANNSQSSDVYTGVLRHAHRQNNSETRKVQNEKTMQPFSTVGIDISDWTYPRTLIANRGRPDRKPILFDTWDFAGQEVYQISHQYFISKRCVYLLAFNCVQKTSNGRYKVRANEDLFRELKKWLNNIHCRIPKANFILVGTRKDQVRGILGANTEYFKKIKDFLIEKFVEENSDPASGIPRIHDVVFVKILDSGDEGVTALCNRIWEVASEIKSDNIPHERDRNLIDIEVPQKYQKIEVFVKTRRQELRSSGREPILSREELESEISAFLVKEKQTRLEASEFNAMIHFMNENGIILHYDSVLLSNKFFVDPQWLCDQLANVITVKEIQSKFGTTGIVRIDKLKSYVKGLPASQNYTKLEEIIVPLLSQFEVALKFGEEYLLIPSSLPTEKQFHNGYIEDVDIPAASVDKPRIGGYQVFANYKTFMSNRKHGALKRNSLRRYSQYIVRTQMENVDTVEKKFITMDVVSNPQYLSKYYVFPYVPFGFWPRLLARMVSDEIFAEKAGKVLSVAREPQDGITQSLSYALGSGLKWSCWKTGLELSLWDHVKICEIKEVLSEEEALTNSVFWQSSQSVRICKENLHFPESYMEKLLNCGDERNYPVSAKFNETTLKKTFPRQTLSIKVMLPEIETSEHHFYHNYTLRPSFQLLANKQVMTKFFGRISQQIDSLLVEWYPSLGEDRLKQIDKNDCLVERILPCPQCLQKHEPMPIICQKFTLELDEGDVLKHSPSLTSEPGEIFTNGETSDLEDSLPSGSVDHTDLATPMNESPRLPEIVRNRGNSISASFSVESPLSGVILNNSQIENLDEDEESDKDNHYPDKRTGSLSERADISPTFRGVEFPNRSRTLNSGSLGSLGNVADDCRDRSAKSLRHVVRTYRKSISEFDYSRDYMEYLGIRAATTGGKAVEGEGNELDESMELEAGYKRWATLGRQPSSSRDMLMKKLHVFVEEEILLLACAGAMQPLCPAHGYIRFDEIAPNFLFIDLPQDKIVPKKLFHIEKYMGQGGFGAVFSGYVAQTRDSGTKVPVACKYYQPLKLPDEFPISTMEKSGIESKQRMWMYEPARSVADAYVELRQEMSVLMQLKNDYIVSFYGASLNPIALVMDVAPMGSLNGVLESYKEENSILKPQVVKVTLIQVATALSYLHSQAFVYRDLKPANVLVWKFPDPKQVNIPDKDFVLVRLADYGICKQEISDGMIGKQGTPPYMAPEILSHEGKEIYTNKIDIYSFGMMIYDIVCLSPPWWVTNFHEIRNMVLDSKRPALTNAAKQNPNAYLDLLCCCTLPDPNERPTSDEIIEYLNQPEACKLIETVELKAKSENTVSYMGLSVLPGDAGHQAHHTIGLLTVANQQSKTGNIEQKLFLDMLFYRDYYTGSLAFSNNLRDITTEKVTAYCTVYNTIWLGTESGRIIVLCVVEGKLREQYRTDTSESALKRIIHLVHPSLSCVICSFGDASVKLFSFTGTNVHVPVEFTAYLEDTRLGKIYSACIVNSSNFKSFQTESGNSSSFGAGLEIWFGVKNSEARRYSLTPNKDGIVPMSLVPTNSQHVLQHDKEKLFMGRLKVSHIAFANNNEKVWSVCTPGSLVFVWDLKEFTHKAINCASRSQRGHDIVEVCDLKYFDGNIYVALNCGTIVTLHASLGVICTEFVSHTQQALGLCPLEPFLSPTTSPEMVHYKGMMLKKEPRFLTVGYGDFQVVKRDKSSNNKKLLVKLWNTYGDHIISEQPSESDVKTKKELRRSVNFEKLASFSFNRKEKADDLRPVLVPRKATISESDFPDITEFPFEESVSRDVPVKEYVQKRFEERHANQQTSSVETGSPTPHERPRSIAQKIFGRKIPRRESTVAIKKQNVAEALETVRENGWAIHTFHLDKKGYLVKFDNGIQICFPENCVDAERIISVRLLAPSHNFVLQHRANIKDPNFAISSLVVIESEPHKEFKNSVAIKFPWIQDGYTPMVLTTKEFFPDVLVPVKHSGKYTIQKESVTYQSRTLSPIAIVEQTSEMNEPLPVFDLFLKGRLFLAFSLLPMEIFSAAVLTCRRYKSLRDLSSAPLAGLHLREITHNRDYIIIHAQLHGSVRICEPSKFNLIRNDIIEFTIPADDNYHHNRLLFPLELTKDGESGMGRFDFGFVDEIRSSSERICQFVFQLHRVEPITPLRMQRSRETQLAWLVKAVRDKWVNFRGQFDLNDEEIEDLISFDIQETLDDLADVLDKVQAKSFLKFLFAISLDSRDFVYNEKLIENIYEQQQLKPQDAFERCHSLWWKEAKSGLKNRTTISKALQQLLIFRKIDFSDRVNSRTAEMIARHTVKKVFGESYLQEGQARQRFLDILRDADNGEVQELVEFLLQIYNIAKVWDWNSPWNPKVWTE